jgi:hypothetical protein
MHREPIDTIEYRGYQIKVYVDQNADNPRGDYSLGKMVCWHHHYDLGDERLDSGTFTSRDGVETYLEKERKARIILPVYMYQHGCIALSTSSFRGRAHHAEWDSGQVGFIYATRESILETYGGKKLTKKLIERATKLLEGEVETYGYFVNGEVYGYEITKDGNEDDVLDSCWGFYGPDWKKNGLLEMAQVEINGRLKTTSPVFIFATCNICYWDTMTQIEPNRIYVKVYLDKGDLIHVEPENDDDDLIRMEYDGGICAIQDYNERGQSVLFYDKPTGDYLTVEVSPAKSKAYFMRPINLS